jgi:predicted ATPase
MSRLVFPSFGKGAIGTVQHPKQISAGFHQVFPIVVQLGRMRQGELIAVENPEAHLHPALQIKITEMLIAHANSGRHIFVETHSDLVVRRTMRGLLSEEIPQASVHIYFSELTDTARCEVLDAVPPVEFYGSTISLLTINESVRIVNWPADFLDEDMRESQRLLDIMYGKSTGANDNDE